MMLRIVAGLRRQAMVFERVREPTGSPVVTYERTINLRISLGLSSSCRTSSFSLCDIESLITIPLQTCQLALTALTAAQASYCRNLNSTEKYSWNALTNAPVS